MSAAAQHAATVHITARILPSCPVRACLVVDVPQASGDLWPGLFCDTAVVPCAHCTAVEAAKRDAEETARMEDARAEEDAATLDAA